MKITETVTRDCCQQKDLKRYMGQKKNSAGVLLADKVEAGEHSAACLFCQHCGQVFRYVRKQDASGGMSDELEKLAL